MISDDILERAIADAVLHLQCAQGSYDERRQIADLMRRLIAMRSPARVAEMERERGLVHGR